MAAAEALKKGEDSCWELLDDCDCGMPQALKDVCGDDPRAIIEEMLRLTRTSVPGAIEFCHAFLEADSEDEAYNRGPKLLLPRTPGMDGQGFEPHFS